jgi:hypothetical protein
MCLLLIDPLFAVTTEATPGRAENAPFLHEIPLYPPHNLIPQPENILTRIIATRHLAFHPPRSASSLLLHSSHPQTHPRHPSSHSHQPHAPIHRHVLDRLRICFRVPGPYAHQELARLRPAARWAHSAAHPGRSRSLGRTAIAARNGRRRMRCGGIRRRGLDRWS